MTIRPRRDADLDRCVETLAAVQASDGYPIKMPTKPLSFLLVEDLLGAWIAETGDRLDGHVLLRRTSSEPVMELASEAGGVTKERLGVVARLFVAPWARRRGVGKALLAAAAAQARELGRYPILDVVDGSGAAGLYESAGWRRAGKVHVTFRDGQAIDELVYLAPPAPTPSDR